MIVKYLNEIIYTPEENIPREKVEKIINVEEEKLTSEMMEQKQKEEEKTKKMQSVVAALQTLGSIRYVMTEIQDSFDYNHKQQITRLLEFHKNENKFNKKKEKESLVSSEHLIGEETNVLSKFFCQLLNHSQNVLKNHLKISKLMGESLKTSQKENSQGLENYSVQFFWRSLESEIERLITSHLMDNKNNSNLNEISKSNRPLFKFSNSSASFDPQNNESSLNKDLIVSPNPFHVIKLFPHISTFSENVTKMLESGIVVSLKENLDSFIVNKFFNNLESFYLNKLNFITNLPSSFKINDRIYSTYQTDELFRSLLPSSIKVYDFVHEIIGTYECLDSYVDQFSKILNKILQTYYDRCYKGTLFQLFLLFIFIYLFIYF